MIIWFSWIDPTSLDVSNNKNDVHSSTCTSPINVPEESNLYTSPVDDNDDDDDAGNDDTFEDEVDVSVDQWWLEDDTNFFDPWKDVQLEPIFQYGMEDDESLFHEIDS